MIKKIFALLLTLAVVLFADSPVFATNTLT